MRWQGAARIGVVIVGVGCAAALYFTSRHRVAPTTRPATPGTDPEATVQAGPGTVIRTRDENGTTVEVWNVKFEGVKQYSDSRVRWEKAVMTFKTDGTVISADLIETKGTAVSDRDAPGEILAKGHAHIVTPEGNTIDAEEATYNDATAIATIPGALAFTRGRMNGTGTSGSYSRDTGAFQVNENAKVIAAPAEGADPSSGQVEATSKSLTFTRANKAMLFDVDAKIVRAEDTLTADRATLYLAEDEQQFRVIELRGKSRVIPVKHDASATPDMQADDIDLAFYAGTQMLEHAMLNGHAVMLQPSEQGPRRISGSRLDLGTAPDGKTVTQLTAIAPVEVRLPRTAEAPERIITATTLNAQGDAKSGLTAALFEGGVTFTETTSAAAGKPASKRVGTARDLALTLKGQLDAIDQAEFRREVKFTDADVTGDGDLGVYAASKGALQLRPARGSKRQPHVKDGDLEVWSDAIDVNVDTDSLDAIGAVNTKSTSASEGAQNNPMFSGDGPMIGQSEELHYDGTTRVARYVAKPGGLPVRLTQGESVLRGDEVVLNDKTRDIVATGRVESTWFVDDQKGSSAGRNGAPSTKKFVLKGDRMVYQDAQRKATYTGVPATLNTGDSQTSARELVLTLAAAERKLERLEATGDVIASLSGDRDASAARLVYDAPADRYTLTGKPVKVRAKDANGGCSLSTGNEVILTKDLPPEWPMRSGGNVTNPIASCKGPIK